MKISGEVKALPQDKVLVLNYRKRPAQWEPGIVDDLTIKVNELGKTRPRYTVLLDRGQGLVLYVSDDSIQKVN